MSRDRRGPLPWRLGVAGLAGLLLVSGCTADPASEDQGRGATAPTREPLAAPSPAGPGSIASEPPASATPAEVPAQVSEELGGAALPTSQWWTSALIGPLSEPLWAHPLAVDPGAEGGLALSSQEATVSADAIVTPFVPSLQVAGEPEELTVTGYGAFDVRFDLTYPEGTLGVTVVQGSPVVWLSFRDGLPVALTVPEAAQLADAETVGEVDLQRVTVGEGTWDLVADAGTTWQRDGDVITADGGATEVAVAIEPRDADPAEWAQAVADAASPVTGTREDLVSDPEAGTVRQTLVAERASGTSLWALLPHLADAATGAGTWPDQRGDLTLAVGDEVTATAPMPGLLSLLPDLDLDPATAGRVAADLAADLAAPGTPGGSYFGGKEMGRLAVLAEVATALGDDAARDGALGRLRTSLEDLLTFEGPADPSYLAYDPSWGGIIAVPAEFGSQDYNDHHFHYGYVLYAAAVLGAADPGFVAEYREVVDLLVRDFAGTEAAPGDGGLPPFRVWNAYEGASAASGYALFADGNNQESSSEAVHAWESVLRWGLVTGDERTIETGVTHYAWESATARRYWLGEGADRPDGFEHTVIGILWGAKTDYATWFDPAPEAVEGIQLLPLTLGSLYRADPVAAAGRSEGMAAAVGGEPRTWGDLFVVDLALSDPVAARARLAAGVPAEPSTSTALTRLLVELLAAHGPPQPAVTADGPHGLAFGAADAPLLIGTNPTDRPVTVTFRAGGQVVGELDVPPHSSVTSGG